MSPVTPGGGPSFQGGPLAGRVGLMAGLWLGQALGMFLLPGFGVSSSSPQVPRHPTSMCNTDINLT